jgi:hypothetical protein
MDLVQLARVLPMLLLQLLLLLLKLLLLVSLQVVALALLVARHKTSSQFTMRRMHLMLMVGVDIHSTLVS